MDGCHYVGTANSSLGVPAYGVVRWGDYGVGFQGKDSSQFNFTVPWQSITDIQGGFAKSTLIYFMLGGELRYYKIEIWNNGAIGLVNTVFQFYKANGRLPTDAEYETMITQAKSSEKAGCLGAAAWLAVTLGGSAIGAVNWLIT